MGKIDMMSVVISTIFIPEVGLMKCIVFFGAVLKRMVKLVKHDLGSD